MESESNIDLINRINQFIHSGTDVFILGEHLLQEMINTFSEEEIELIKLNGIQNYERYKKIKKIIDAEQTSRETLGT